MRWQNLWMHMYTYLFTYLAPLALLLHLCPINLHGDYIHFYVNICRYTGVHIQIFTAFAAASSVFYLLLVYGNNIYEFTRRLCAYTRIHTYIHTYIYRCVFVCIYIYNTYIAPYSVLLRLNLAACVHGDNIFEFRRRLCVYACIRCLYVDD